MGCQGHEQERRTGYGGNLISFYFFPSFFLLFWCEGSFTPSLKSGFPHTLPQSELLIPALNQGSLTLSFSQDSSQPPSLSQSSSPGAPSHPPSPRARQSSFTFNIYINLVSHFGLRWVLVARRGSSSGYLQDTRSIVVAPQAQ